MVTPAIIEKAQERISDTITTTPLLSSDRLNRQLPFDVHIKAECLQRTGSFKEICTIIENDFADQVRANMSRAPRASLAHSLSL